MSQFGPGIYLMENQLYTIRLQVNGEIHEISFTSKYSPLFSSVRLIRSDYKELLASYTNDEINRKIHDNSKLAIEIADPPFELDAVPFYAKQYVRYKTILDLAKDLFLNLSTKSGTEDKQLSDMRIMKQVQAPYLKDVMNILENQVAAWEAQLGGLRAAPRGAVRAGANTYPLNPRSF